MFIYRVERNGKDSCAEYQAMYAAVVTAPGEERARQLVADCARDEGPGVWLDTRYSVIHRIGTADHGAQENVEVVHDRE